VFSIPLAVSDVLSRQDLFVTADLLEVQMADRTGWFLPREPISTTEDIEIQTMYSHILEVEPSPMISELSQEAIYRLLPRDPKLHTGLRDTAQMVNFQACGFSDWSSGSTNPNG